MNIKQIIKYYVDRLYSNEANKATWCDLEDAVLITPDSCTCYKIPGREVLVAPKRPKARSLRDLWAKWEKDAASESYRTANRQYILQERDLKRELVVYNDTVFVDKQKLRGFDRNAEIRIRGEREPVMVIEEDELVGVVFPVNPLRVKGADGDE